MHKHQAGYTVIEATIVIVVAALVIFCGYLVFNHGSKKTPTTSPPASQSQGSSTTSSTTSAYAVLAPATVPSKTAECSQAISYASNGVPGSIQCANGDLNATDWQALAALEPNVLSLGYGASESQVQSTLCSDVEANISNPIEETVYQIATLYYGWNFPSNPSVVLSNGTCQNVDD
ncbi:MAG TPA: hypothetical protein VGF75_05385 [Candidatus Saccharimonadales bacterium]|jgi:hypothetical protein